MTTRNQSRAMRGHHQLDQQGQHRIERGAGQAGRHQQGAAGQAGRDRHAGQAKPFAICHRRAIAQPEGGSDGTNRPRRQQRLDDAERDDLDRPLAGVATGPQAGVPHRGRVGQQLGADERHRRGAAERGAVEDVVEAPPAQQQERPGEHQQARHQRHHDASQEERRNVKAVDGGRRGQAVDDDGGEHAHDRTPGHGRAEDDAWLVFVHVHVPQVEHHQQRHDHARRSTPPAGRRRRRPVPPRRPCRRATQCGKCACRRAAAAGRAC